MSSFGKASDLLRLAEMAAARHLGMSPAMATKHVNALEARLGVKLFHRTTRRLSLTEAGVNRPGFPRRLGASGSDAAQTLQAAGRQHWNDDVWGYRTFRCS